MAFQNVSISFRFSADWPYIDIFIDELHFRRYYIDIFITDNVKIVDSPHHCSYVYESIGLVCLALFAYAQISRDCHTNSHLVLYLTLQAALYFLINFLFEVTNIRSLLFRLLGTACFAGLASLFLLH